jgi:hypothetical protein
LFELKVGIFVEDHDDYMMIYCPLIVFSDGAWDKPRNNYFVSFLNSNSRGELLRATPPKLPHEAP